MLHNEHQLQLHYPSHIPYLKDNPHIQNSQFHSCLVNWKKLGSAVSANIQKSQFPISWHKLKSSA